MIRSKITSLLIMAAAFIPAFAQDEVSNTRYVGVSSNGDPEIEGAMFGEAGTYDLGAILSSEMLSNYTGCKILGIRVNVDLDLGRTPVYLYELDENRTPTLVHTQNQKLYEGWNEVIFNGDGFDISGEKPLFFGFSYTETPEMVASKIGAICAYEQSSQDGFVLMRNNTFFEVSNVGDLCIQLIVDISTLPKENVVFSYFDTGFKYKKLGETFEIFSMLTNVGRIKADSYELEYDIDGGTPVVLPIDTVPLAVGAADNWQYTFKLPETVGIGSHTLNVRINKVNGVALNNSRQKQQSVNFALYENSYQRNRAYVELYNSQSNYLAPFVNTAFNQVDPSVLSHSILVSTFPSTDKLGVKGSDWLHALYPYTYPSFTVNRSFFPGEKHIAYDVNDYILTLNALVPLMLEELILQDAATPSFAEIELLGSYNDATRELTVIASGNTLDEAEAIYGDIALTLMVVEDKVIGDQKIVGETGYVTDTRSYNHNNVLRSYITAPAGDRIAIGDGKYNAEFKTTLDKDWDTNNLRIVGILSKYGDANEKNLKDYDVINATEMFVGPLTGVVEIDGDVLSADDTFTVYTLQGICLLRGVSREAVEALPSGIYIVNGRKVVI